MAARAGVQQRWQGCRFPPRAATRAPYYRSCGSFSKKPTRLRTLAVALVRGSPWKDGLCPRLWAQPLRSPCGGGVGHPCGRPAVAVWADLTPMGLVPHNGSMPHATPARCKHPRPTTVRTSPPKNLPVQRCQVRASGLQSSQQVGDAPVKLWKQWHEQVKQMFVCC